MINHSKLIFLTLCIVSFCAQAMENARPAFDAHFIAQARENGKKTSNQQFMIEIFEGTLQSVPRDIDVDLEWEGEFTPLILAATRGFPKIVAMLIEAGASVHQMDPDGRNALQMAALYNEETCCEVIVESMLKLDEKLILDNMTPETKNCINEIAIPKIKQNLLAKYARQLAKFPTE